MLDVCFLFTIFFNDLCGPIEIYIYVRKNHSFTNYPAAKYPKYNKLAVTDTQEKPVDFFNDTAQASTFGPAISLLTWVSLHKFPLLFGL